MEKELGTDLNADERQAGTGAADLRPVIVYDGQCAFCRGQMARVRRRDTQGRFDDAARETPGLTERFPSLAQGDFNKGMRLIMPDGQVHVGSDAVYHIARQLPVWRRLAWLYRVPVLHGLARLAYGWVAANRQRLGRSCTTGACELRR